MRTSTAKRAITHIVIHTAAAANDNGPVDQSASTIRAYHMRVRGYSDIGYHYVVRFDGTVEHGRPVTQPGAHVEGFNRHSIGICFTGHGDLQDFTDDQYRMGIELVAALIKEHGLTHAFLKNPMRVLGHRECYGQPGVRNTGKTCPGTKVDMSEFRKRVIAAVRG